MFRKGIAGGELLCYPEAPPPFPKQRVGRREIKEEKKSG